MFTYKQRELIEARKENFLELAKHARDTGQPENAREYIKKANRSDGMILREVYHLFPYLKKCS